MAITDATNPQTNLTWDQQASETQAMDHPKWDIQFSLDGSVSTPADGQNDRLKEEDAKTQVPEPSDTQEHTLFYQADKVPADTSLPTASLEEDMHIIQKLQETSPVVQTTPIGPVVSQATEWDYVLPNALQGSQIDVPSVTLWTIPSPQAVSVDQGMSEIKMNEKSIIPIPSGELFSLSPAPTPVVSDSPTPTPQLDTGVIEQQASPSTYPQVTPQVVPTPVATAPVATTTTTTMNLDTLTQDTAAAQPATVNSPFAVLDAPLSPIPIATSTMGSAILQTPMQPIATPATTTSVPSKHKWVKVGLFVVLFVALGFLTYFIISTMYPMGLFATKYPTGAQMDPNDLIGSDGEVVVTDFVQDSFTGSDESNQVVVATGEENLSWSEIATNVVSGEDVHASATDENFQDMDAIIDDAPQAILDQGTLISTLQNYHDLWAFYLEISKENKDLISMKYSLYLKNKTETLISEVVANPTAMTTMQERISTELQEYQTFLQKLESKYGTMNSQQATTTQEAAS